MSDNSSEIPENPDSINPQEQNPIGGMFDSWNAGKIEEPRDIAGEEREKASSNDKLSVEEAPSQEKALIERFLYIFDNAEKYAIDNYSKKVIDPKRRDSYELIAQFEDAHTRLKMDMQYMNGVLADESLTIEIEEVIPYNKEERRIPKNFLFGDVVIPEYFKIDGQVWEQASTYNLNLTSGTIDVTNTVFPRDDLYSFFSRKRVIPDDEDIQELDSDVRAKIFKDDIENTWHNARRQANEDDYEQLQSFLFAIKQGEIAQSEKPAIGSR